MLCFSARGSGAEKLLELDARALPEASGLAQSQYDSSRLWLLNDSGNSAKLYALDVRSGITTAIELVGAANRDWEDLAGFSVNGRPWMAVGDIGDNFARRETLQIYLLPEPEDVTVGSAKVFSTLEVRYPDGARDAESLAIDSETGFLYVLTKRDPMPRLYRLKLPQLIRGSKSTLDLEFVGEVTSIPAPTEAEIRATRYGRFRAQPTSMAFSPAYDFIALLTYGRAYFAPLSAQRSWLDALNDSLCPLERVELTQGETITINRDGEVLVSSEGANAPLYRIAATCDP